MEGKKMAYARVSSTSQNLARQIEELKQYVDEANIVVDKASGKDLKQSWFPGSERAVRATQRRHLGY